MKATRVLRLLALTACFIIVASALNAQLSPQLIDALPAKYRPGIPGSRSLSVNEKLNILKPFTLYSPAPILKEVDSVAVSLNDDLSKAPPDMQVKIELARSTYYELMDKFEQALSYCNNVIRLIEGKEQYTSLLFKCKNTKGIYLSRLGRQEESVAHLYKVLDDAMIKKDSVETGITFYSLSFPYFFLELPETGVSMLDSSILYIGDRFNSKDSLLNYMMKGIPSALFLGYLNMYEKTNDTGYISLLNRCIQLSDKLSTPYQILNTLPVLKLFAREKYTAAVAAADSLLSDTTKVPYVPVYYKKLILKKYKGLSFIKLKQNDKAIAAFTACNDMIDENAKKRGSPRGYELTTLLTISDILAQLYADKKDWKRSYYYSSMNKEIAEKIDVVKKQGKVFEAVHQYDIAKKEVRVKQLANDNRLEKKQRDIAIVITIAAVLSLLLIASLLVSRYKKLKLKSQLIEQEAANQVQLLNIASQIQIDELEEKALAAKAEEQKRLGQELHDDLAGTLAAAKMKLENEILKSNDSTLHEKLKNISEQISAAYESTRSKSHEWYNKGNEKDDIAFSKRIKLIAENALPEGGYTKEIMIDDEVIRKINTGIKINVLRIIQEALTNVLKHAKAHHVTILMYEGEENAVLLEIIDDGKGFDTRRAKKGIGLSSINSRVEEMKGELVINASENGTKIKVIIPSPGFH